MNTQAAVFDDAGEIIDLIIFTSGWFRENLGASLATPLCAIFRCVGNRSKKVALATIMDASMLIATYAPIFVTVVAADNEAPYAEALTELFNIAAAMPFPLKEKKNATTLV